MNYAEYRRDLNHCYMILKTDEEGEAAPEWQTGILEANRIPGLLPMAEEHIDNETCYRYDVTSVQPFDIFCRMKRIGKDDLKKMLVSLVTSLGALDDYLLDADHLLLDPEYLYIDGVAEELRIPYVPSRSRDIRESLRELMEYLLLRVDHEDQECVVFASRILHELKKVNTELSDLPGLLTNDGLNRRPSGPEHMNPEELSAGEVRAADNRSSRETYGSSVTDNGRSFASRESKRKRNGAYVSARKMRGAHGTGSGMGARTGAFNERYGRVRETDPSGAVRQDTVGAVLREEKRKLIPEAATVRIALVGSAVAAAVYIFLHAGVLIFATPAEAALAAAAAAAAVLAAGLVLTRKRQWRTRAEETSDMGLWELSRKCREEAEMVAASGPDLSGSSLRVGSAKAGTGYGSVENDEDFRPDSVLQSAGTGDGQAMYREDSDETVLLGVGGASEVSPRGMSAELIPAHSGTDLPVIRLEGKELLVGKHARAVDVVLPSGTVSRIHARVFMSGGEYYLSDLGSRNGTSVDGHMAVGNEEILLTDGAGVKFADLEYVFRRSGGRKE